MNKTTIRLLDAAITAALADVEKSFDVKITIDGGSYIPGECYMPKLRVSNADENGVAMTPEMLAFKGRHPEMVGKTYNHPRLGHIEFTGLHNRRPRYPYTARVVTSGVIYKLPRHVINEVLPLEADAA